MAAAAWFVLSGRYRPNRSPPPAATTATTTSTTSTTRPGDQTTGAGTTAARPTEPTSRAMEPASRASRPARHPLARRRRAVRADRPGPGGLARSRGPPAARQPEGPHQGGWYADGPRPGEGRGTVLTDGHTYRNNSAIFRRTSRPASTRAADPRRAGQRLDLLLPDPARLARGRRRRRLPPHRPVRAPLQLRGPERLFLASVRWRLELRRSRTTTRSACSSPLQSAATDGIGSVHAAGQRRHLCACHRTWHARSPTPCPYRHCGVPPHVRNLHSSWRFRAEGDGTLAIHVISYAAGLGFVATLAHEPREWVLRRQAARRVERLAEAARSR